jgi:transcriptional regulator of acetoin/glycerol metabolism
MVNTTEPLGVPLAGAMGVTVALKVTAWPNVEGFTADPTIIDSWERCKRRFDPWSTPALVHSSEPALETALKTHTELLTVAIPYIEDIHQFIEGSDCAILLADGIACILAAGGDQRGRDMIDQLGLRRGAYCTEGQLGTTALGLGLIAAMPVQVVGAEHYFRAYHHLVSTAAPIHDEHGRITGILAIIGPVGTATSHTLSLVMAAARASTPRIRAPTAAGSNRSSSARPGALTRWPSASARGKNARPSTPVPPVTSRRTVPTPFSFS